MTSHLSFNFHNLVGLNVKSDDPFALQFFELENRFAAGDIPQNSSIVNIRWGRQKPSEASDTRYISSFHKFLARWSYAIKLSDKGIDIDAFGNRTAVPMIHHMLVHPSLRYLCTKRDAMMLHGSAVVVRGKSVVFTGLGGTGKTTISSLMLKHGGVDWKLHADDYVFLTTGSISHAYVTRAHLYRDQIRWVPSIKSVLTPSERLHLEFFGRIREITRDGLKWPLRIEASRLWPNHSIAPEADLAAVILLKRGKGHQPILRKKESIHDALDELIQMNFYEARHFIRLFGNTLEDQAREIWLNDWKKNERTILGKILQETSLFQLELPHQQNVSTQYGEVLVDLITPLFANEDREKNYE